MANFQVGGKKTSAVTVNASAAGDPFDVGVWGPLNTYVSPPEELVVKPNRSDVVAVSKGSLSNNVRTWAVVASVFGMFRLSLQTSSGEEWDWMNLKFGTPGPNRWRDVCKRGHPAGGKVREDDVNGKDPPSLHDAKGTSPGILRFLREVVRATPATNVPPKPSDFPIACRVETYPGHSAADVHFEGRAADVFISYISSERVHGDWLFDWCVRNCTQYQIQGVIFGDRQWFSEMNGGAVSARLKRDHMDHVHIELNGDGAAAT